MATFTDPKALLRYQTKRFQHNYQRIVIEHQQLAKEMLFEARELTSGTVKTKTLRKLGHPFGRTAKGRKRGSLKALPINVQSGRLRKSWKLDKLGGNGSLKITYMLYPTAEHAIYVLSPGGTTKMVARGFWRELKKRWRKKNFDLLVRIRAIKRA